MSDFYRQQEAGQNTKTKQRKATLLPKVAHLLDQYIDNRRVGESAGIAEGFHLIGGNLAQNSPHNLAALAAASHRQRRGGDCRL